MGVYPRSWKRFDPPGAAAEVSHAARVLTGAVGPQDTLIELELTGALSGYTVRLSEVRLLLRHHLYCHFVAPVTSPLLSIVRPKDSATLDEGADWPVLHGVGDYELRSPMPEQTGGLLAAGLSAALLEHPVDALQILPTGASLGSRAIAWS